jgi:quercetin dioxygenase-like cupin family protein
MVKGWFIGGFTPTALSTADCEVAVKTYKMGEQEDLHYHRVATEITVVVSGSIRMLDRTWSVGDIIVLEPGVASSFEALTDTTNVVVKLPGALSDKYIGNPISSSIDAAEDDLPSHS